MYTYLSKIIFNLSLFQFPNINQKLKNPNPPHSHHYYSPTTTITNNLCWRHQEEIRYRQLPASHPPTTTGCQLPKMNLKKKKKNQHILPQSLPVHHSYLAPLGRDGGAIKAAMSGCQPWIWRRMVVIDTHQQDVIKWILDMDFEDKEWWWIVVDVTSDLLQVAPAKLVVVIANGIIWVFVFYFFGFWFILGNWNSERLKIIFYLNRCTCGKYLLVEYGVE